MSNKLKHIEDKYRLVSSDRNNKFDDSLSFIEAAITTSAGIMDRRMKEGVFTEEGLTKFFDEYLPGYIYSTGLYMTTNRHNTDRQKDGILNGRAKQYFNKDINSVKSYPFLKNHKLMLDSAGHQVIMGYLPLDTALTWTEHYFDYVHSNDDVDFAFSLDIHADIPTPGFTHPQILWDANCKSCDNMLETLDEKSLQKIIWVLQFKGQLLNLWDSLHIKYDIFKKMNKFAIGGVAQGNNAQTVSYPLYVIPAALIIAGIKENLWSDYYLLHILGVMAPLDFLQFAIIQRSAKRFHNINLHVSNDGSSILRGQSAAAKFKTFINGKLVTISFKSLDIDKRVQGIESDITNGELLKKIVRSLSSQYGFKDITDEDIYLQADNGDYKLNQKYWSYIILASYMFYSNLQNYAIKIADIALDYFEKGNKIKFNSVIENYLMLLNGNKLTRNLHAKKKNYWESVELLKELNHDNILNMNKRVFPDLEIFKHGDLNVPKEFRRGW